MTTGFNTEKLHNDLVLEHNRSFAHEHIGSITPPEWLMSFWIRSKAPNSDLTGFQSPHNQLQSPLPAFKHYIHDKQKLFSILRIDNDAFLVQTVHLYPYHL